MVMLQKEREKEMSNRRAAIRRDKREREKILKSKAPGADMLRIKNEGWEEGKTLALCVGIEALYEYFGWRKERLYRFADTIGKNSANCNKIVMRAAVLPWQQRLLERITEVAGDKPRMLVTSIKEKVMYEERNQTYIAAASIVMVTLFSEYNFSSNSKRTGRMDKIIERYTIRYLDILGNHEYYCGEKYTKRIKEMTGMNVA